MGYRQAIGATAVVLTLGLTMVACGDADVPVATDDSGGDTSSTTATTPGPIPDGAEGLDEARRRWASAGVADYEMTYQELCFCPQAVVTVTVRNGEVVDTSVEQEFATSWAPEGRTVEDLFGEIQQAIDTDAAEIQATYDPTTGRPTRYWIDSRRDMADEEHGVEVASFTVGHLTEPSDPIDPGDSLGPDEPATPADPSSSVVTTGTTQAPTTRAVATAQFTRMAGCWSAFEATTPEGTTGLSIHPDDLLSGPTTVALPTAGWTVEVQLGHDLFSVACADRDMKPLTAPEETLAVTGGTITVTPPALSGCGTTQVATAVASDLTLRTPDGSTITLPELTLTSDQWGCSAG